MRTGQWLQRVLRRAVWRRASAWIVRRGSASTWSGGILPRQPPGHRIDAVTGSTTSKARLHNPETAQPPPVVTAALSREDTAHHPSAMEPILPCLDAPSFPSPKPPCRLRGARQAALRLQTPPVAVEQASSSNNTTFAGVLEANLQTTPGLRLLSVRPYFAPRRIAARDRATPQAASASDTRTGEAKQRCGRACLVGAKPPKRHP